MSFRVLNELIEELERIINIFKKNPNRKFKSEYLLNKTTIKNNLKEKFNEEIVKFGNENKEQLDILIAKFKSNFYSLGSILNDLSEEILNSSVLLDENEEIFENMDFDLKSYVNIIPEFDGQFNKYSNFINFVEFIYDTLNENGKIRLIDFILKTKLSDAVRLKLAAYPKPITLNELKENISKILKSNKTSLSIQSELSRTRQNNLSVIDFSSKIESLISELNSIQISQRGEQNRELIILMNDEIALNAFKTGLNDKLKPTIIAGRPKSLNDAISLAMEAETPQQDAKVFSFKSHSNNNKKSNYNNKYSKSKFCKYCKKKGHEIQDCFKKKKSDNKKNSKNSENFKGPESHNSGNPKNH